MTVSPLALVERLGQRPVRRPGGAIQGDSLAWLGRVDEHHGLAAEARGVGLANAQSEGRRHRRVNSVSPFGEDLHSCVGGAPVRCCDHPVA